MLADERGRWILSAEGRAELALTGVLDGQLETVVLDRVLIDENGQHWIVDYKTSSHEGGNLDGFLKAESERYQPQLQKYATLYNAYADTTARCALYFPLLQTFVEL
jgi:ATP-dependent exoDNAse (exonuclease V) beta subunit